MHFGGASRLLESVPFSFFHLLILMLRLFLDTPPPCSYQSRGVSRGAERRADWKGSCYATNPHHHMRDPVRRSGVPSSSNALFFSQRYYSSATLLSSYALLRTKKPRVHSCPMMVTGGSTDFAFRLGNPGSPAG
eukprot:3657224-Pyramimonas_sp.AAC.1